MKYLALLLLVSCAANIPTVVPLCAVREVGTILGSRFTVMECSRQIVCDRNDTECQFHVSCANIKNDDGMYNCVRRD